MVAYRTEATGRDRRWPCEPTRDALDPTGVYNRTEGGEQRLEHRHPVTVQQQELLKLDLADLKAKLDNVVDSIRTCHGEQSAVYVRAQEIVGALQRLEWAIDRDLTAQDRVSIRAGGADTAV